MVDPRLLYGTTLGQVNPLAPNSLVQQGGAEIPTGTVKTEHEPNTEKKVLGDQTKGAMGAMDSAYQAKLNALDEKAKADIAREPAQLEAAQQKAKIAEDIEKEQEAARKAEEARKNAESAERAKALAEFEKVSRVKTLFEDASPLRKFVSAVAIGAGAYASKMNGGPNDAFEIYKEQEENYRKSQEANIKKATERVLQQTKSAEEARKYFTASMEDLDKKQVAKLKVVDLQLAAIEKTHPEAAARAAEARAKVQIEYEKDKRDFVGGYDETVRQTGTTTQTSSGNKDGGASANRKTESEQKLAMLGSSMKAELNAIAKGPALTERDLQGLQKNTLGSSAADKAAESGPVLAFLVGVGRWADIIPKNRYDKLPESKKIVINAWDNAVEKYARILTGAGMPAEEARRMSLQNAPVAGDGHDIQKFKFDRLTREADFMMSLSNDAKAAIVKRLQEGETFSEILPVQEAPQPAQPTGKVGSPTRARAIPPAKQEAAIGAADDYVAVRDSVKSGKVVLTPNEKKDIEEAYSELKKDPTHAEAAKFFRQLRQRKGI